LTPFTARPRLTAQTSFWRNYYVETILDCSPDSGVRLRLRLMECVRLRVKDVDFGYLRITVRDGKGAKDRITMLPTNLAEPLQRHLRKVQIQHEEDLEAGFGSVYLPTALERKLPNAPRNGPGNTSFRHRVYRWIRARS
jgi:integrase